MRIKACLITYLLISITVFSAVAAGEPDEKLGMFAGLLGKQWEGRFEDAEEPIGLEMNWEVVLDGSAVEMKGKSSGLTRRNVYYWDSAEKRVAYLALTSNGYIGTGYVAYEDSVLTFVGPIISPDGRVNDAKACWEFLPDGHILAVGYIKKGDDWQAGHKIRYFPKEQQQQAKR